MKKENQSNQKKKTIILTTILSAIAVILIALLVCFEVVPEIKSKQKSSEILKEFYEKFNSKQKSVIYYASSECSYCSLETPILETISEDYNMDYYYIDATKLTTNERNEILEALDIQHATPTTLVVENGKVVDKNVGYLAGKEYVKFFIDAEMIPKDAEYSKEKNITFIDFDKYSELIKSNGTNIIVIGQTGCSHCTAIKPALNSVSEDYSITINYLNMTDFTDNEKTDFFESLNTIEYKDSEFVSSGSIGTPLLLVVTDGKVSNYISGERTTSQLVKQFTKFGLID